MLESATIYVQCDYHLCHQRHETYQPLDGNTEIDIELANSSLVDAGWLIYEEEQICPLHREAYLDSLDDDDSAADVAADNAERLRAVRGG